MYVLVYFYIYILLNVCIFTYIYVMVPQYNTIHIASITGLADFFFK